MNEIDKMVNLDPNANSSKSSQTNEKLHLELGKDFYLEDLPEGVGEIEQIKEILSNSEFQKRGIDFDKMLKLAGYYGNIKDIEKIELVGNNSVIKILIKSKDIKKLEVVISFGKKEIEIEELELDESAEGIGSKYIGQMILLAQKFDFNTVTTIASKLPRQSYRKNQGYYFFPKIGFIKVLAKDNLNPVFLDKINKYPGFENIGSLYELFTIKDKNGKRVGLDIWKEIGDTIVVDFDLNDENSLNILNEYLNKN